MANSDRQRVLSAERQSGDQVDREGIQQDLKPGTGEYYIGIDIGSVSINVVAVDGRNKLLFKIYQRNSGQPVEIVKESLLLLNKKLRGEFRLSGIGVTGSGRQLIGYILGADLVKNEISAHAAAAAYYYPEAGTIFEIGGQDSKLIIIREGVAVDFAMNTVCAAGTGSFLDHQAQRLGVKIEEFGELALRAGREVRIAGRCTVFAESDMISKQQYGFTRPEIIRGLCRALVRNYINNLVRGRKLQPLYIFQGGVAANIGIKKAFEEELDCQVIVPEYYDVMGALGIAMLVREEMQKTGQQTSFRGFSITRENIETLNFICQGCANECEIVKIESGGEVIAMTGDRCGRWSEQVNTGPGMNKSNSRFRHLKSI